MERIPSKTVGSSTLKTWACPNKTPEVKVTTIQAEVRLPWKCWWKKSTFQTVRLCLPTPFAGLTWPAKDLGANGVASQIVANCMFYMVVRGELVVGGTQEARWFKSCTWKTLQQRYREGTDSSNWKGEKDPVEHLLPDKEQLWSTSRAEVKARHVSHTWSFLWWRHTKDVPVQPKIMFPVCWYLMQGLHLHRSWSGGITMAPVVFRVLAIFYRPLQEEQAELYQPPWESVWGNGRLTRVAAWWKMPFCKLALADHMPEGL